MPLGGDKSQYNDTRTLPLTGALKGCLTPDGLRPVNNGEEIAEGATIFNVG